MENKNSDEIIVKFEEVTKQYGDLVVLDKLDLDIKKNEMVSIIGPSGSGKTTVLRVLMTLEKINGGVIHLDGEFLTLEQQMSIKSCKFNLKIAEIDGIEPKRIGGTAKMRPLETGYMLSKQIFKEMIFWN